MRFYEEVLENGLFLSEEDFQATLESIHLLEDEEMRILLRQLLVNSGTFKMIDEERQRNMDLLDENSTSELEHRLKENANQKKHP